MSIYLRFYVHLLVIYPNQGFLNFVCHGPVWVSGETYRTLLIKMCLNV